MGNIIDVKNLTKKYKNKTAVSNLSFSVKKGEIFGLLGHNGAGKSTTVECILGLKKYDSGFATIFEKEPAKNRKEIFEKVSVQLQQSAYQEKIKVYELCEEISALYKKCKDYKLLLKEFNMEYTSNVFMSALSGGEKQKVSIILALIPQPDVIFLDELTTGLDTVSRREIWQYLLKLKEKNVTILLTSHYMDEVENLCDRICILKNGREVISGSINEVIKSSSKNSLEEAYLYYMEGAEEENE